MKGKDLHNKWYERALLYCKFRSMKDSHIKCERNLCCEGTTTGKDSQGRELACIEEYSMICGNEQERSFLFVKI